MKKFIIISMISMLSLSAFAARNNLNSGLVGSDVVGARVQNGPGSEGYIQSRNSIGHRHDNFGSANKVIDNKYPPGDPRRIEKKND